MFIKRNKYSIEKYKILGDIYKGNLDDFISVKKDEFLNFSDVVQKEVHRPLKDLHLKASFYEYEMARAANFSVPGAGKTAMILGVFAYLNREGVRTNDKINRMLVVAPINAFNSWKKEFCAVFGDKKKLVAIDSQSEKEFEEALKIDWEVSNLVLVNYESLPRYSKVIQSLLNEDTMLIFDEVHRIKNPEGQRAKAALEVSTIPKYKFVLTGTPIPNSYQDVYNFLNILYGNEYNAYFGWSPDELKKPNVREIEEINERIHPFFWRTNKKDLGVPSADADIKEVVAPSNEQVDLAESIYYSEKSGLARLIRLIQASTNPGLLEKEVTYSSMGFEDDGDVRGISESDFNELLNDETDSPVNEAKTYGEFELNSMGSPKFTKGIELIEKLVSEGKKVIVWGIFVETLRKIKQSLLDDGIRTHLVYGQTPVEDRTQLIDEFRDGSVQVMISNPQTLGESISLHQTVHDAIYFEYNFNLTFMLQSRDRIHRLGLDEHQYTRYYYLQTQSEPLNSGRPGYIDENIYDRLKNKEQIMYGAIDDDTLSIEYTTNEIQEAIQVIDEERGRIMRNKDE